MALICDTSGIYALYDTDDSQQAAVTAIVESESMDDTFVGVCFEEHSMPQTIFKRIIDGEIKADIVYQDDRCLAFRDLNAQAPTHVLIIPKQEIPSLAQAQDADAALLGHLLIAVRKIAEQLKLIDGYRVVINCGPDGGQSVDHLHLHLLGGRPLDWPPG